jgi:hypothetical protein
MLLLVSAAAFAAAATGHTTPPCRDRFLSPFGPGSLWNTAIGSEAVFVPANLYPRSTGTLSLSLGDNAGTAGAPTPTQCANMTAHPAQRRTCPGAHGGITRAQCAAKGCCFANLHCNVSCPWCFLAHRQFGPLQFHNDNDYILAAAETDPLVTWYQQGWWGSGPKGDCEAPSLSNCNCHCDVLSHAAPFPRQLHIPSDFLTTQGDGCSGNNGLSMLQPDNVTVIQTQPAYRCKKGGPLLSQSNGTIGCPQPHPLTVDITSSGPETALGAHGGSGLSAIGGTIRLHEIGPDAPPIAHVLKLELFAHQVREDCIENS